MLQRFASALFGGNVEELSLHCQPEQEKRAEEEDEDWILVNYLAETCSAQCGSGLSGSTLGAEEEEEDEGLVMIPSPVASPPDRYASCTSLNSTAETDPDGRAEEEEEEEEGEHGFFRLDVGSLEESWFVTPPPCFTGRGSQPVLETSPLENLLIEHPSMSVYAYHSPPRLPLDALPHSLDLDLGPGLGLDLDLGLLPENKPTASKGRCEDVKKGRRTLDAPHRRPEAAIFQRHATACYSAARAGLLRQRGGGGVQSTPPLSRNGLRRLNLLRPPKANSLQLHQPSQRHLNF